MSRRKASLAASAALVGGLGAVLLTPGTALAAVNTSTAIGSVTQSLQPNGTTTLDVSVNVDAGGGAAPDGTVTVSGGSGTCDITLAQIGSTSDSGGSCDLTGLSAGTYRVEAAYAGSSDGFGASATSTFVRVDGAPASSASHSGYGQGGRLSTSLSCTSPVRAGNRGTCTLYVTNAGYGTDRDVVGTVSLPRQLQADFCGHSWGWSWSNWSGCSISGNTASENLGNLSGGQTKTVTVTFTARSSNWLWGRGYESAKWVHVTGSASSDQYYWGWNGNGSYTGAWVRIVPRWY
ncbi:MAG: hypothetical protein ACRDPY_25345 [Streptosporangiaceae bacterium]